MGLCVHRAGCFCARAFWPFVQRFCPIIASSFGHTLSQLELIFREAVCPQRDLCTVHCVKKGTAGAIVVKLVRVQRLNGEMVHFMGEVAFYGRTPQGEPSQVVTRVKTIGVTAV